MTIALKRIKSNRFYPGMDCLEEDREFDKLINSLDEHGHTEGSLVNGVVAAIDGEDVYIEFGMKTDGVVPLKEFALGAGQQQDIEVGKSVRIYLDKVEGRDGFAVLSHEKALREEKWEALEAAERNNEDVYGVIFSKVKGGCVVDIDGVVAFLPGSQIDISMPKDVDDLFGISQRFRILKMDRKQGNIVVSRRAILEAERANACSKLLENMYEGQILQGVVKSIAKYGAFIDLGGVDGLLHITDISWSRISHPSVILSYGQQVAVKVISFDIANNKISLGMKQLDGNPWDSIEERYPVGSKHKGYVTNIADYGIFVELTPGIEGLVHASEICWQKLTPEIRQGFPKGAEVDIVILRIDLEKSRMSLSIKRCTENPWETFAQNHPVGSIFNGQIMKIGKNGMLIDLGGEIAGSINIANISDEYIKTKSRGDFIEAKVIMINAEVGNVELGVKQIESDPVGDMISSLNSNDVLSANIVNIRSNYITVALDEYMNVRIDRSYISDEEGFSCVDKFSLGDRIDVRVENVDKNLRQVLLSVINENHEVDGSPDVQ